MHSLLTHSEHAFVENASMGTHQKIEKKLDLLYGHLVLLEINSLKKMVSSLIFITSKIKTVTRFLNIPTFKKLTGNPGCSKL